MVSLWAPSKPRSTLCTSPSQTYRHALESRRTSLLCTSQNKEERKKETETKMKRIRKEGKVKWREKK